MAVSELKFVLKGDIMIIELIGGGPQDGFKMEVPDSVDLIDWRSPSKFCPEVEYVYVPLKEQPDDKVFKMIFAGHEKALVQK